MTLNTALAIPALLGALLLTACGEKTDKATDAAAPAEVVQEPAPATPAAAAAEPAAPVAATQAGGYTPSAEELVPGVTMSQEEIDKQFAEARAGTPVATVPGDEPAAAPAAVIEPAPVTPADATPAN